MERLHFGQVLSRRDIALLFGGNARAFLPRSRDGVIVAGCFDPAMNPRLPHEVLVHSSINAQMAAERLVFQCRLNTQRATAGISASQDTKPINNRTSIPVFVRLESNVWQFQGVFRAVRYTTDLDEVAIRIYEISPRVYQRYTRRYGEMRGILFLEEV